MEKPDVDHIEGLSLPAISIEQKSTSHNPSLYGRDHYRNSLTICACCTRQPASAARTTMFLWRPDRRCQMVDNVLSQPEGQRLMLLAPIIKET